MERKIGREKVTYSIEVDAGFVLIENVPARVNADTGEQLFAPETVECLQKAVWEGAQPARFVETPVYDFRMLG